MVPRLLRFAAGKSILGRLELGRAGKPGTIPAVAALADYGPTPAEQTKMIAKTRVVVLEVPVAPERTIPAPKLGREGRREIGRALGAMYDDVLRQGVPPRIVELLDGLDALAHGNLGSGRVS
jgi:hypothetical protein